MAHACERNNQGEAQQRANMLEEKCTRLPDTPLLTPNQCAASDSTNKNGSAPNPVETQVIQPNHHTATTLLQRPCTNAHTHHTVTAANDTNTRTAGHDVVTAAVLPSAAWSDAMSDAVFGDVDAREAPAAVGA